MLLREPRVNRMPSADVTTDVGLVCSLKGKGKCVVL